MMWLEATTKGIWVTSRIANPRVLLLLRILGGLDRGKHVDRWKLQKTTFLAEIEMQKKGIGGLDYEFLKDKDGPLSHGIYEDMDLLMKSGFVSREYDPKLTDDGRRLYESLEALYDANEEIEALIASIVEAAVDEPSGKLRQLTHDMEVEINGERVQIDKLPPYYSLIHPLPACERKGEFDVSAEWQETIEILGDRVLRENLMDTFSKMSSSDFIY